MKNLCVATLLAMAVAATAPAASFSFQGTFTSDTDVVLFTFTLANPTANVSLRTYGYAGGTNAALQVIPQGGFEPVLGLFMSDGSAMNPGLSGPCGGVLPADAVSGACADVYYPTTLSFPGGFWAAGTYTVSLSVFANAAVGNLSDGFFANVVLGLPNPSNFTCIAGAPGYQGTPPTIGEDQPFCDQSFPNTQRTGNWALDIVNVDSASVVGAAAVPEPATAWGIGMGLAVLALRRVRR